MPLDEKEMDEIARRVVEKLRGKDMQTQPQKPVPKCELKWENNALVLECETAADRDQAKDIIEKGDVRIRVKPKDEEPRKNSWPRLTVTPRSKE